MTLQTFGYEKRNTYSRYSYNDDNGITLIDFEFYNKNKSLIPKKKLNEIRKFLDDYKDEHICWTNKDFIKNNIFFSFYNSETDKEIRIEEKKLDMSVSDIEGLKYTFDKKHFLKFKLSDDEKDFLYDLGRIRSYYNSDTDEKTKPICHDNFDSLKNYLITGKHLNKMDWRGIGEIKNIYKKMFPDNEIPKIPSFSVGYANYRDEKVYYILDVVESRINDKNYRSVLFCFPESNKDYNEYKFVTYCEDEPIYFQMDAGRLCSGNFDDMIFLDNADIEYTGEKIVVKRNLFTLLIRDKSRILEKGNYVISQMIYNFYKERVVNYEENSGDKGLTEQQIKILDQYRVILKKGKTIKMDNLIVSKGQIKLNNENFTIKFDEDFIDIVKNLGAIKKLLVGDDVRYNFNVFYEKLLEMSCLNIISMDMTHLEKYKSFKEIKFTLNDIPLHIEKIDNRIRINNVFCRIADVQHILSKAICYTSEEDYNKYVKDVSHIGAEWMRMISSGVAINLNNPFFSVIHKIGKSTYESVLLRFSLTRDIKRRNVVYLILNDKKYKIKYKGKFKQHFNYPRISIKLKTLKRHLSECIEGIDDSEILSIVENAIQEAKIIQERGEELIKETVKDIKAIEGEFDINGNKMTGYKLIGRVTNTEYFIKKSDLSVYRLQNGSWNRRCVVDDHTKQRIFEDKLANRLVNIYNEPRYIYTLH